MNACVARAGPTLPMLATNFSPPRDLTVYCRDTSSSFVALTYAGWPPPSQPSRSSSPRSGLMSSSLLVISAASCSAFPGAHSPTLVKAWPDQPSRKSETAGGDADPAAMACSARDRELSRRKNRVRPQSPAATGDTKSFSCPTCESEAPNATPRTGVYAHALGPTRAPHISHGLDSPAARPAAAAVSPTASCRAAMASLAIWKLTPQGELEPTAVPAEILLIRAFPDSISYCILSHSVRGIMQVECPRKLRSGVYVQQAFDRRLPDARHV